ncbi:MAG: efflux RND transporter periplasmic adaptor subunit [Myxococcota bacterium]|nr:efflux RND transporter periplasmic adaptor subunit [Myxococcota bacterium]
MPPSLSPTRRRTTPRSFFLGLTLLSLATLASCDQVDPIASARAADPTAARKSLVSMARLEPASGTIRVASPTQDTVETILVDDGEKVAKGQILVRLSGHRAQLAQLEAAELSLERAQLKLLDIEAQEARLRSAEAELTSAENEVASQEGLSEKGFTAGKEFRDARLRVLQAKEQEKETRTVLERLTADASLSQREAENEVEQARARLEEKLIRSPIDGRVLRMNTRPGELVGTSTIVSLGETETMVAVAEVHANEIRLVQLGQSAEFTSPALPRPLEGRVEEIGEMILSNDVLGEDPRAPRGLRVVQVRVRLEPDALAEQLTNLEGQLRIHLEEPGSP